MIYRPTLRHLRIFVWFFAVLGVGVAALGFATRTAWPVIVVLIVAAYGCCARYMRSITVTDEGIEFRGIIRRWSIDWQQIRHVKKMKEYGWPIDRMFGEATYEIKTEHGRKIVSFLLFHGDCIAHIKEKIRPNKRVEASVNSSTSFSG